MKRIYLEFPKSETRLAGFPYGELVFNEQAKNLIVYDEKIEIVFPNHIEKVASSFIQGFFSVLVSKIGYKGIEKDVTIKTGSDILTSAIWKNIY